MGESGRGRKQRFAKVEELSDITIFSDTSAIEIFINNGETVLTTRVYSEHLEQKVELVSREVKEAFMDMNLDHSRLNIKNRFRTA